MPLAKELVTDRATLEAFAKSRAAGVPYGDHRILCRILGDYLAFVDCRDLMLGPRLVLDGFWESWVTLAIARYLKPGMYCVDVGANYGYYSLLMASAVGSEGRVLACEPNPILAETYLPDNVALNGMRGIVEISPTLIGETNRDAVDFVLHDRDFATSSLAALAHPHSCESIQLPMTTIDELTADWPRLDLVKVDAEGAELKVWNGMRETRRRFPSLVIVIELHLDRDTEGVKLLLGSIETCDKRLAAIDYEGAIQPVTAGMVFFEPERHWTIWIA